MGTRGEGDDDSHLTGAGRDYWTGGGVSVPGPLEGASCMAKDSSVRGIAGQEWAIRRFDERTRGVHRKEGEAERPSGQIAQGTASEPCTSPIRFLPAEIC